MDYRDDLYFNYPKSYHHLTIGMIKGNYLNTIFEDYAKDNQLDVDRKYYNDLTSLNKALEADEVDLIVNGGMNDYNRKKYIAKLGSLPAYFITSIKQKDIMDQLNVALNKIELDNPYYVAKLHEKYYGDMTRKSIGFTKAEQDYIEDQKTLTVAYEQNNLPYEYYDSQKSETKGIFVDLLRIMGEKSGLKFNFEEVTKQTTWQMVKDKKADMMLSATPSLKTSQDYAVLYTDSYYDVMSSLVAYHQIDFDVNDSLKVAMLFSDPGIVSEVQRLYPQWEIIQYETIDQCIEALQKRQVDGFFASTLYLHFYKILDNYPDFIEVLPDAIETPICIGVSRDVDNLLISILNKSIHKMSNRDVDSVVVKNLMNTSNDISVQEFVERNPLFIICISGIMIALCVFVILQRRFNKTILKKNELLEERNRALETARETEKLLKEEVKIDTLSGLLNKGHFEQDVKGYLEKGNQGVFMIIDIDNFKEINDYYGHYKGDEVIREFGKILEDSCRLSDVIGRTGGDEFAVFLKDIYNYDKIVEIAEFILARCKGVLPDFSCSIGIAFYPSDADDFDGLYQLADQALYQAKRNGGAQYQVYY